MKKEPIPTATKKKCPKCGSNKILSFGYEQVGDVSRTTGELQGEKTPLFICSECNQAFKLKQD